MKCATQIGKAVRGYHHPVLVEEEMGENLGGSHCESRKCVGGRAWGGCSGCEHVRKIVPIFMCRPFGGILSAPFHMGAYPV